MSFFLWLHIWSAFCCSVVSRCVSLYLRFLGFIWILESGDLCIFGNFSAVMSLNIDSFLYYLLAPSDSLIRAMLNIPLFSISIKFPFKFFISLLFFLQFWIIFSELSPIVILPLFMSNLLFHLFIEFLNSIITYFKFLDTLLMRSACYFKYYLLNIFNIIIFSHCESDVVVCILLSVSRVC